MSQVWMVRAGERGYLIEEFRKGYVGIGWNEIGDLSGVADSQGVRDLYLAAYPATSRNKAANAIAMIFKFRSALKTGEKVVTYDPTKREYLIGSIASDYIYQHGVVRDCDHIRKVVWEDYASRDQLTVDSRNSLGSTLTVFKINEEVWADLISAKSVEQSPVERHEEEKEELEQLWEDTASKALELIKDKVNGLSDEDLERLAAAILRALGYRTKISPKGPDRGVDVLASPDGLGLQEPRIKVEVKHRPKTPMGAPEIRSFLGGLRHGDRGLYVSTGGFSREAKYEADRSPIPVSLLDLDELATLIISHYENFDLEGRTLIPLFKVYYPRE